MAAKPDTDLKRLLSTEEAAEYLGISIHWLKTARFRPELAGPRFIKIGRVVRYDPADISEWLAERRFRGTYEIPASGSYVGGVEHE